MFHRCLSCPLGAYDFELNEGQEMVEQMLGSQGLGRPKLLLSGSAKRQVISDAPGVQNQLIHKLCNLLRIRLLGSGQRISKSSLSPRGF